MSWFAVPTGETGFAGRPGHGRGRCPFGSFSFARRNRRRTARCRWFDPRTLWNCRCGRARSSPGVTVLAASSHQCHGRHSAYQSRTCSTGFVCLRSHSGNGRELFQSGVDIETGERGKRDVHVDRLFRKLLGDQSSPTSTIVVNNNAAAVFLALNTLAENGEVIVSRGELVEIGGSFRIPDVMSKSKPFSRGGHHQPHTHRRL